MLKAIVMGPVNLLLLAGEYIGAGAVSLWTALSAVGPLLGSTARAVRSSVQLAPTMTAAKDWHSQVGICTRLKLVHCCWDITSFAVCRAHGGL